ncbi:MAG: matrixin family metalloprotease [Actinomycetota bacterium]
MDRRRPLHLIVAATVVAALAAPLIPLGASSQPEALPQLSLEEILAIAKVAAPPPGVGLKIHADFPEEAPLSIDGLPIYSLTADISTTGVARVEHAVTAQESTTAAGIDECTDPTFTPASALWAAGDMPIKWRFRAGSTPRNVSRFLAHKAIRKAHRVWPRAHSDCSNAQTNNFAFGYAGNTGKRVGYDGVNMIDFGRLGSESLAVNYTWYSKGRILEVDMRLNKRNYAWTAKKQGKNYNIMNVVTHELGHQVGLEDLSDPHGSLTMFARISRGETHKVTLGRGDLRGANHVTP